MKKILLAIVFLALVGCGHSIRNDSSSTSDYEARFESVFTSLGTESNFGSAVYQVSKLDLSLKIYTLLSGSYEVRSDSCNFLLNGRYTDSQVISIPLSTIIKDPAEKLCTVTIQINPEYAKSQYEISPRYSVIYLQYTARAYESYSFQYPQAFDSGKMFYLAGLEKYRLIQNCVNAAPRVIKESLVPSNVDIYFSELEQKDLGSCYYSLVYTKNSVPSRLAFSVNIYNPIHEPLQASITSTNQKLEVISESTVSVCAIGGEYKLDNKCKGKPVNGVLIQVHTNKRSFYKIWSK